MCGIEGRRATDCEVAKFRRTSFAIYGRLMLHLDARAHSLSLKFELAPEREEKRRYVTEEEMCAVKRGKLIFIAASLIFRISFWPQVAFPCVSLSVVCARRRRRRGLLHLGGGFSLILWRSHCSAAEWHSRIWTIYSLLTSNSGLGNSTWYNI